jgi:DNA excision repair protein ERCC-4
VKPGSIVIICDTREQRPPPFPDGITLERATLHEGDYTTPALRAIGIIERKSVGDFAATITHGRDRFDREIERLRSYRWKAIVVEGELGQVYRDSQVHPHSVIGSIASFYARADLPTLFAANPAGAGRLIAGILRRWEERVADEARGGGQAA